MKKITILVPVYNEELTIRQFVKETNEVLCSLPEYEWEYLFVNDGSKDSTDSILEELSATDKRVKYVMLSRNFGKEIAMMAGFDFVDSDAMIIMDVDLQDPPTLIPQMIHYWKEGYEDVYAKREDRGNESFLRKRFSLLFYSILQHSTKIDILENVGDFRLLDKKCIMALRQIRESQRYTKGLFCWIGYKKKEIIFNRGNRSAGSSNWNFLSLINLAIEGITTFTISPLRIASFLGLLTSVFTVLYALWIFIKTLLYGDPVAGFPTLIIMILFLGGVQLLSIGIIGEYLGRIFNEVKGRPGYLVSNTNIDLYSQEN